MGPISIKDMFKFRDYEHGLRGFNKLHQPTYNNRFIQRSYHYIIQTLISRDIRVYNIVRLHPNLIPICVIMVHFSTYPRPWVYPMTCASRMGEACARYVITNILQGENTIRNQVYL